MYGVAVSLEKPLQHYFNDRPYVDGNTWSGNGWSSNFDAKLAPLSKVEDQADALTPTDGVMGDGANGDWDGDKRTTEKSTWGAANPEYSNRLNPFDIDKDGKVELPVATDPDKDNSADEYTLEQVLTHTITHEICHALAGPSHSAEPSCLMYNWSVDWKRDGYLSDGYRALLRVHNKKR
jgi:hypothetical protein